MNIEELPDFPAIRQLADALWHHGPTRGAAVLVGAGFSRGAERPGADTPLPPLWENIAGEMRRRMGPETPDPSSTDPLRLAEEYRASCGQASLDGLIRALIRDEAWTPGQLHTGLLELPWSDVLTTNWDTLLERAARRISARNYEPVRTMADLAHAHAPRIVKLHGSIGTSEHFIVAEDDYRTYPMRFAAFVNLARQVFIENELCLLGFSGDDPNFIQWSGWVRDHLDQNARRIYLVNVLNLSPSKRKFLEARNIAPIDLAPLVRDRDHAEKHSIANQLFLDFLAKAKPRPSHEWTPTNLDKHGLAIRTIEDQHRQAEDPAYSATCFLEAANYWRQDREAYPGWIICPASERLRIRLETTRLPRLTKPILDALDSSKRGTVLYELAWRYDISFWRIPKDVAELLATVADPGAPANLTTRQQLEIAAILLRVAREEADAAAFARWRDILQAHSDPGTDLRAEMNFQDCLWARDHLDLQQVRASLQNIVGPDPVWRMRRASLLYECGEFIDADSLVSETVDELRQRQRDDRLSLWVQSRRGWAEWLARAMRQDTTWAVNVDRWPMEFKIARCDPWDELQEIGANATEAARKAQSQQNRTLVPRFEPAHYRDPSNTVHFVSVSTTDPAYELDRLSEAVGIPLRMCYTGLLVDIAKDITTTIPGNGEAAYQRILRIVHHYDDPLMDRCFGRISIARLSEIIVTNLTERVTRAITFWRSRITAVPVPSHATYVDRPFNATAPASPHQRRGADMRMFAISRLRLFIEILARLAPRMNPKTARAAFDLACDIARDSAIQHPWLYDELGHLVRYSVSAVPLVDRKSLILSTLEWPLPGERPPGGALRWPNPIDCLFESGANRPDNNPQWIARIDRLIDAAKQNGSDRVDAILRLAHLAMQDALTPTERDAFGQALWSQLDSGDPPLPQGTELFPHMFADLPAPPAVDGRKSVRERLYRVQDIGLRDRLASIAAATSGRKMEIVLKPTPEQAVNAFDAIIRLRSATKDAESPIAETLTRGARMAARRHIGVALALSIVPSIRAEDRTVERAEKLVSLISELPCPIAVAALPYFTSNGASIAAQIVYRIRRAIFGRTFEDVAGADAAIRAWLEIERSGEGGALPRPLIDRVIVAVESTRDLGLYLLISCIRRLVESGKLEQEDYGRIDSVLEDLIDDTAYTNPKIDAEGEKAISLSLVRAECVRLSETLRQRGMDWVNVKRWLDVGATDPLPEVRFALRNL